MCKGQRTTLVLLSYHRGLRDLTPAIRPGNRSLDPLSHLASHTYVLLLGGGCGGDSGGGDGGGTV